ncbi:MAG: DegV family protein [Actinocatenispora sp.]
MRQRVVIVTDSTASLPAQVVEELGIHVVPLQVRIGDTVDNENRVDRADLLAALRNETPVGTAEPPSSAFFWDYQGAADAGAQAIVSIHISSRLSGTCESAWAAGARSRVPVHVVDSLTSGMSLGFLVIAAAQAARSGAGAEEIVGIVTARRRDQDQLIYVDTLEHLRRGGRIGAASAMLGTALSIKPLLAIAGGEIVPLAKVRGTERALIRLVDIGGERVAGRTVDAAIEHVDAPDRADELVRLLRGRLPMMRETIVTCASAVLAAHLGPGTVGIALAPC